MGMRLKFSILLSLFGLWIYGVYDFYNLANDIVNSKNEVDGIVILTGASERIKTGLNHFYELKAKRALISGVSKSVKIKDFQYSQLQGYTHILGCIDIGYGAVNTFSNSLEAAIWVRNQNFKSIVLVTSRFHMPRSLYLFKETMPEIMIYPIIVDASDSTFFHFFK